MGRLDDIIERNRNPQGSFRKKPKPAPVANAPTLAEVDPDRPIEPDKKRLDAIVERNRNPKGGERLAVGLGVALFMLLIIGLMVFTDLGRPVVDDAPSRPRVDKHAGDKRVDGVMLR